jgi:hypothetical protein
MEVLFRLADISTDGVRQRFLSEQRGGPIADLVLRSEDIALGL